MRLIDADAPEIRSCEGVARENVLALIAKQPTVDAVQVVRCRDCKNLIAFADGHHSCGFKPFDGGVYAMDYCSRGELRK